MLNLKVANDGAGKRADIYVHEKLPEVSRAFIHKLFTNNLLTINDSPAKPSHTLKISETITIDYDFDKQTKVSAIKMPIIYEDDDCLVANKPAGILTHSKGAFNPEPTVATFIAPKLKNLNDERGGIVHRLDRATSGVIICAKTPEALKHLQKQFSTRKVKKVYNAVIAGSLVPGAAMIDIPIQRNPKRPETFRAGVNGKAAQTMYKTLQSGNNYSLLELVPKTGRTHQLRVHLKYLGRPIVGDNLYGGTDANRMYLHAKSLRLILPSGQTKTFVAPMPKEFNTIVKS